MSSKDKPKQTGETSTGGGPAGAPPPKPEDVILKIRADIKTLQEVVTEMIERVEEIASGVADISGRVDTMETNFTDLSKRAVQKPKGKFGGKRTKTAVQDTETGLTYPSKAACGKALCELAETTPDNTFAWYALIKAFPDRFVELEAESDGAKAAWKQQEDDLAEQIAEQEAANAKEEAEGAGEGTEEEEEPAD